MPSAALLLIDIQVGFDDPRWGVRNNLQAEHNAALLLEAWRRTGRKVIHVQHASLDTGSPLHPLHPGFQLKDAVKPLPGELVVVKNMNSAFIGTNLEAHLRDAYIQQLVIVGLTTPHCVSTTARMAGNLTFETYVVSDATAAFALRGHDGECFSADEIHRVSLATLHEEFATIVSTHELLRS